MSPASPVVAVGSCFADNITAKMRSCLWDASVPLGVQFNPLSIADAISLCLGPETTNGFRNSLFGHGDLIHSWKFDSGFSALSRKEAEDKFEMARDQFIDKLDKGRKLIITFGTAYCYFKASEPEEVVANCHKMPASLFVRRRVSAAEITQRWRDIIGLLEASFPGIEILMTVSPVRHVRDGLHENNLSKATLLLAVDQLCSKIERCHYFPAYELLNDDLRDYRFYASDLVHPSEEAVEYIWERFCDGLIDKKEIPLLKEGESIMRRILHRHIAASEETIRQFNEETLRLYWKLKQKNPAVLEINV